jgi:hypothetical protein
MKHPDRPKERVRAVTPDYDARRTTTLEPPIEGLDLLREAGYSQSDDADLAEGYELAEEITIADEGLTAPVIPIRADEFRCGGCFLVLHRSMRAPRGRGPDICRDCA